MRSCRPCCSRTILHVHRSKEAGHTYSPVDCPAYGDRGVLPQPESICYKFYLLGADFSVAKGSEIFRSKLVAWKKNAKRGARGLYFQPIVGTLNILVPLVFAMSSNKRVLDLCQGPRRVISHRLGILVSHRLGVYLSS